MSENRVQINPELTAVALTYSNSKFIAEDVLPKVPVTSRSFRYREYDKNNHFLLPETRIGEKGIPNEVEFKGELKDASVEDHALKEYLPVAEQKENEANGLKKKEKITNQLTRLLKTRKELIVSSMLANVNSYGGNNGNVQSLSADDKINKDTSNAVTLIQAACDKLLYAPNVLVTSRLAMSALRMNPFIVDAVGTAAKKAGLVSIEAIKELFGLENIFVGESVVNTAKKGQAVELRPCWENNISLLHIDKDADTDDGVTFGFEGVYEDIQVGEYHDSDRGIKGCDVIKAFYSSKYLHICSDCGYLIKDVI